MIFPPESVAVTPLGLPLPAAWATTDVILLTEFILTFLLMTSVFGTAVDDRGRAVKIGGFGIGLTVTFDILAGGAVNGASMNPARSFGPALELPVLAVSLDVLGGTDRRCVCRGADLRACAASADAARRERAARDARVRRRFHPT